MRYLALFLTVLVFPAQAVLRLDTGKGEVDLYGKSYALVVGASSYKHWPRLPGVKKDVALVKAALEKHGFEVTTVIDPTRSDFDRAMRGFIAKQGQDPTARLLFYYAGHGYTLKGSQGQEMGYMVPVDTPLPSDGRGAIQSSAVSMLEIEIYAKQMDAKHALFLFDSCFSGSIFSLSRAVPAAISDKTTKPVRQFITAGAADQEVPDDSVFRRQFVAALAGEADLNRDGYVTASELSQFLEETVINYTRGAQTPQYGKIRDPYLDKGDFVFFLPKRAMTSPAATRATPGAPAKLDPIAVELSFWESIRGSKEPALYRAYIDRYPKGQFVELARIFALAATKAGETRKAETSPAEQARREAHKPGKVFSDCSDCPPMVVIPAGEFTMGSPASEAGRFDHEGPQRTVKIAQPFALGRNEVTFGEFERFAAEAGYKTEAERDVGKPGCFGFNYSDRAAKKADWQAERSWRNPGFEQNTDRDPVICVSWNDAKAYIRWLSGKTAKTYRLPTEAEWEYAARAGTKTARYWGDDPNQACLYANVGDLSIYKTGVGAGTRTWLRPSGRRHECNDGRYLTAPAGSYRPNGFGLYDMLGNVWEWTEDCWNASYKGAPADGSVWLTGDCSRHVFRGSSWALEPRYARSANRARDLSDYRLTALGFRIARRLE